jgi:hypothetical protein
MTRLSRQQPSRNLRVLVLILGFLLVCCWAPRCRANEPSDVPVAQDDIVPDEDPVSTDDCESSPEIEQTSEARNPPQYPTTNPRMAPITAKNPTAPGALPVTPTTSKNMDNNNSNNPTMKPKRVAPLPMLATTTTAATFPLSITILLPTATTTSSLPPKALPLSPGSTQIPVIDWLTLPTTKKDLKSLFLTGNVEPRDPPPHPFPSSMRIFDIPSVDPNPKCGVEPNTDLIPNWS